MYKTGKLLLETIVISWVNLRVRYIYLALNKHSSVQMTFKVHFTCCFNADGPFLSLAQGHETCMAYYPQTC